MKRFDVKVSENASIAEIAGKIAKSLSKHKQLENKKGDLKLIGSAQVVEIIDNQIQINVTRNIGKHDELIKCYCGNEYMKSAGTKYRTNYGGRERVNTVCSSTCFDAVKEVCGDRVVKINERLPRLIPIPDYIGSVPIKISELGKDSITFQKTETGVQFFRNGIEFEPDLQELKCIYSILKII